MSNLFTTTKTFTAFIGMCAEPERDIEVTITNDKMSIENGEFVCVSWFSPLRGKVIEHTYYPDEVPSDDEIASMIVESERADFAWVK